MQLHSNILTLDNPLFLSVMPQEMELGYSAAEWPTSDFHLSSSHRYIKVVLQYQKGAFGHGHGY